MSMAEIPGAYWLVDSESASLGRIPQIPQLLKGGPMSESLSPHPQFVEVAERIFSSANQAHGLKHALEVEQLALEIVREPEFASITLDVTVLSAAALLHDSGHTRATSSWSSDRVEHIEEGVHIAREALASVAPFDTDPDRLRQVCYLILHHDDTNYSFPIKTRCGTPAVSASLREQFEWLHVLSEEDKSIRAMLAILREADAVTATGAKGAERTLKYSLARGLPLFAAGNPLNAWMWEESAVGNVRLAAKRALLDAFTARGKDVAWKGYLEAEELIRALAEENGVTYEQEVHLSKLCGIARSPGDDDLHMNRLRSWEQLVDILRRVELKGDAGIHPYQEATIESKLVEIERLSPLAYYVLKSQLKAGKQLFRKFLTRYGLDPFDLSGIVEFTNGGTEYLLAPPIIEVYTEHKGRLAGKQIWALVDGLHRFVNARRDGYSRIRAVVISNIPEHLPLVPLPLRWEDVKIADNIPEETRKREFRFPDCDSLPDISWFSSAPTPVTARDCRYFFYRDLSELGSSGIRKVTKNEKNTP